MKISFSPPYIDESVISEVNDSLTSGWITTGPKVKALESEIAAFVGVGQVLCVNSWTSGAILMLKWLGVKPGDEVIIPAYTYCATAFAVIHAGAKPVMVDVGNDFNIDPEAVRKAITPRTKAIIPVDIAGYPCRYNEIMQIVKERHVLSLYRAETPEQKLLGRIMVMSDAAHSLGASHTAEAYHVPGADVVVYSLHAVKNVTTAEGGAIALNFPEHQFDAEELYRSLRLMTLNCQTKDAFTKTNSGVWRYDIVGLGMKINMADVNAAIGLAQIRQYKSLLALRQKHFEKYNHAFSQWDWAILPPMREGAVETSYHIYPLRIKSTTEAQRDLIIQKIAEKGAAVNVHFVPLPLLSYFASEYSIEDYPQAYLNYQCEISLPVYPQLKEEETDYIIASVAEAYHIVMG